MSLPGNQNLKTWHRSRRKSKETETMKQLTTEEIAQRAHADTVALTARLDANQRHRLSHIPATQTLTFLRAWHGDRSPSTAIKAKCLDCCCYQRIEVQLCTLTACPLWRYRPFQPDAQPEPEDEAQQPALAP